MGLLSLLPDEYALFETWLKRLFVRRRLFHPSEPSSNCSAWQFLLGVVMIGPWAFLVVYDLVLYLVRSTTYEIPVVGGRARGKARPRAPSLTERPSGHRRKFSLARRRELESPTSSAFQSNPQYTRWRNIQEETHSNINKPSMTSDSTD
ncbi:hypothetical protein PMIN01_02782 [Paraphaeosphaeria minitans]|uniref:Uncharacterized protein n=1 Tax=Paraphaeosphaeria minitans TaxID=565426 RepID=A0A9P6GQR0_9PLEO|nr:hypothetical protein PMIN01_02782 [Paraphaeosphaeria minitans]